MKKGSIVKGYVIIGVLDKIDDYKCYIKYSLDRYMSRWIHVTWIHKDVIRIPTKKEKEEYKKFLLKNGYSYYRGKVTKEL